MRMALTVLAFTGVAWLLVAGAAQTQAGQLPPREMLGPASAIEVFDDGSTVTTVTHPDGSVTTQRGALAKPTAPRR
jgi:hypothetical protein